MKTGLATVGVLLVLAACGKKDAPAAQAASDGSSASASAAAPGDDSRAVSAEETMQKNAESMQQALKEMNAGKDIQALAPAEMKKFLPEEIEGTKRSNSKVEHTNMMGMDLSTAEADYTPEVAPDSNVQPSFHVKITDLGNVSGAMLGGFASWAVMKTDSETDTGYEKSVTYKGFPGQESYDRETKYGSLNVYVGKRFTVEMHGNDVTIEQVRKMFDALDVAKLASMGK